MIITLTNANLQHRGKQLALNSNNIVSIFTENVTREGEDSPETVTFIFCPPHGTWEVTESIEEIADQINGSVFGAHLER